MNFRVLVTGGTFEYLKEFGVDVEALPKISEGLRPNILDLIADEEVHLILNTATRKGAHTDEGRIRAEAVRAGIPMITTIPGARAAIQAITGLRAGDWNVAATQDYFPHLARGPLVPADVSKRNGSASTVGSTS